MIQDKATQEYTDKIIASVNRAEPRVESEVEPDVKNEDSFVGAIIGFATSFMYVSLIWALFNWMTS